ncbi:MAG: phospholipase [Bacteroidia bacterium]|nr:MAG: phospholipase [Bacteroidia bacterium]
MRIVESTLLHTIAPLSPDAERARPDAGHPAVILLHGRGASEDDLLGLSPYFDPHFLIIAVRAPLEFGYGGFTWYDLQEIGAPEPAQFAQSYERLVKFIDDVRTHYPVDPERIVLVGFSMGGVMAYAVSLTEPEKIHSVVAHSAYLPENSNLVFRWGALKGKGFFVAHGAADPVIRVEYARRAKTLLERTEADLVYREYPLQHSMSEESVMDFTQWLRFRIFDPR